MTIQSKQQDRIRDFLKFRANPHLAFFAEVEKMRKEFEAEIEKLKIQAEKSIEEASAGAILDKLDVAKKIAQESARDEIKNFRGETSNRLRQILDAIEKTKNQFKKDLQQQSDEVWARMERSHEVLMANIEQMRGPQGERGIDGQSIVGPAGKDADIKELEKNLPQFGTAFRDGLELLPNGEKMKIDAIEDLREELEKIRQIRGTLGRAMGPSVITPSPLSNITPTGSINGSNTAFTLPKAPVKDGERVYLNGVRMRNGASNDYTLANRTITFNTAPLINDVIIVDISY